MPRGIALLGEDDACARAPDNRAGVQDRAYASRCGSVPVIALLLTLGSGNVFSQIAVFFTKMAIVTFGGAYAVLAYVAQQAVKLTAGFARARCWTASAWPKQHPAR